MGTELTSQRQELLDLLKTGMAEGPVTLASGAVSDFYIDGRIAALTGRGLELIGEAFYELLKDLNLDAVGGPTLGADPIVAAVAMTFAQKGCPINAFIIRKETKGHGTMKYVEGPPLADGARVAILEDVCTTGGSAIRAIERMNQQYSPEVVMVSCLVDRKEGADEAFENAGLTFKPLFTRTDFGK